VGENQQQRLRRRDQIAERRDAPVRTPEAERRSWATDQQSRGRGLSVQKCIRHTDAGATSSRIETQHLQEQGPEAKQAERSADDDNDERYCYGRGWRGRYAGAVGPTSADRARRGKINQSAPSFRPEPRTPPRSGRIVASRTFLFASSRGVAQRELHASPAKIACAQFFQRAKPIPRFSLCQNEST